MKKDLSEIYLGWIGKNYEKIKNGINAESIKSFGVNIDEDIFHDTILKVIKKVGCVDVTFSQLNNYLFVAYKNNFLREQEYARNKYKSEMPEEKEGEEYGIDGLVDYGIVRDKIIDEFGEEEWVLFEMYIEGEKVSEIERKYGLNGMYYRFNKIKKFCADYLKG